MGQILFIQTELLFTHIRKYFRVLIRRDGLCGQGRNP